MDHSSAAYGNDVVTDPENEIEVVLEGGPTNFPLQLRRRRILPGLDKIKIHYNGGYEHFERTDPGTEKTIVYRWVTRTRIAE
ncbi:DUF5988 family protein [Micromonospora sp. NPDC049903]|uniref:DUF5988 family protein n=1 Tax=Micromonospora sp. NPDC049903 TaxID=3364276 RepID=UPI003792487D